MHTRVSIIQGHGLGRKGPNPGSLINKTYIFSWRVAEHVLIAYLFINYPILSLIQI